MTVVLSLRNEPPLPVDFSAVQPAALSALPPREVDAFRVPCGNEQVALGEWFRARVKDDNARDSLRLEGDLRAVHCVGAGMTGGAIHVAGSIGRHLGEAMRGGTINVEGDAGDWAAAALRGGTISIRGGAGDFLAASLTGEKRGMTGGAVLVHGDAGREAGRRMRRGLVAIGGAAGELAGCNMLAGTLVVWGECGANVGSGMRRGTIVLSGNRPPRLPGFRAGCRGSFVALRLIGRELQRHGWPVEETRFAARHQLYHGDFTALGRGEVLVAV